MNLQKVKIENKFKIYINIYLGRILYWYIAKAQING